MNRHLYVTKKFIFLLPIHFMRSSIRRMQPLDEKTLASLEELCKLQCSPEEKEDIHRSLGRILDYIHLLNEVNIHDVPSCNFVSREMIKRELREDTVEDLMSSELFFSNVPDRTDGLVRVPPPLKTL